MLNISTELKDLYKSTSIPKVYDIYFPALDLHINTEGKNDKIVHGSFELSESLCSEKDLTFGACEASVAKFTVADIEQDLKGQWFTIEQVIDGFDPVPLGVYKVDSCVKQDNLRFKDISAYDQLKDTDINVTDWYIGLFPTGNETYTLKQFRESLLTYLGIEYEDEALPNDDMIVEKTIEPTQISGREVLRRCVELNGAFGHIGRYGKFKHIILLPGYGLYPSETLYPAEDLYPVAEDDATYIHESIIDDIVSRYQNVRFEEYTVKEIDKLQIRSEENDIGAIVGTGTNAYVIEGNFLVFGKSASELEGIALRAYGNMAKRPYRPYEADSIGLPYVEVGDTLEFALDNPVTGYVLQRTLTGIQALKDAFKAEGNEEREQNFGVNKEIIQLQGKVTRIRKDVEGVRVEVEDLGEELSGEIDVLAGQVVLKVDSSGNVGYVELGANPDTELTSIKLKADNITLEGITTINGGFKVLEDGTIEAVDGKFSGIITASVIRGSEIETYGNDGYIKSTSWDGQTWGVFQNEILINNGVLRCSRTLYANNGATYDWVTSISHDTVETRKIICNSINGSYPVTSDDISDFVSWDGVLEPLFQDIWDRLQIIENKIGV